MTRTRGPAASFASGPRADSDYRFRRTAYSSAAPARASTAAAGRAEATPVSGDAEAASPKKKSEPYVTGKTAVPFFTATGPAASALPVIALYR